MINWQHQKKLDRKEADQLCESLTKRGLDHYCSAVDETGHITVMWSDTNPFESEKNGKK